MLPIAILGAGLAGLTAARELRAQGLPVIVFEAGAAVGGMARSFQDAEGFTYDFGAHFINNRLAEALGAAGICRTVAHYGEAVAIDGRSCSHPFGLLAKPGFVVSALRAKLRGGVVKTAEDWFRQSYGDALAERVAMPLAEAWSGAPASALSPAVGEKFGAGLLKSLYLSVAARLSRRAVCNGYSHEMPESAGIYHVYPEGGLAALLEPMVRELGPTIRLQSPVEKIVVENERVVAVRVKGETIPVSAVISTAPVPVLPKIVEGTNALDHLAAFRYRPMVFVNLKFEGRGILPDTMLWTPDRSQPFFRVTEAPISMPWLAPEGKTMVTFDIGCEIGDEHWTLSDEALAERCLAGFAKLYPGVDTRYLGAAGVIRTPYAYPVYLAEYEAARRRFAETTGVAGLYSIGRNGEFAHILMEDVYWRTLRRMKDVMAYVGAPRRERPTTTEARKPRSAFGWIRKSAVPTSGVAA